MNETVTINWLLLLAPLCWVLGLAVIIFLFGLMEYRQAALKLKRVDFIASPFFRRGTLTAVILIITGLLLGFLKLPAENVIAVKTTPLENGNARFPVLEESLRFTPRQLKMDNHNKSHILNNEEMKDNKMVLFWDGYVQTPFVRFLPGNYRLTVMAQGSPANGEYSRLKVVFEIPGKTGYLETITVKYIELTARMQPYGMDFTATEETPGRIRVSFFNDLQIPGSRKGRDVWLKDMAIEKRKK